MEDLENPYSTVQSILKKLVELIPYILRRVYQLQQQDYAQSVAFPQSCTNNTSSDLGFYIGSLFPRVLSFTSQDFWTLKSLVFGAYEKQE